jgi:hypothetical protein
LGLFAIGGSYLPNMGGTLVKYELSPNPHKIRGSFIFFSFLVVIAFGVSIKVLPPLPGIANGLFCVVFAFFMLVQGFKPH